MGFRVSTVVLHNEAVVATIAVGGVRKARIILGFVELGGTVQGGRNKARASRDCRAR